MIKYWTIYCGVGLMMMACNTKEKDWVNQIPEAKLVVVEKEKSAEEVALQNKIAARILLQKIIDTKETTTKEEIRFACSRNTGGLLTRIKENDRIIGTRFGQSFENGTLIVKLYYQKDKLSSILYEKDGWKGDDFFFTQTIFYLEQGKVFHCLSRSLYGLEHIEDRIATEEYKIIPTDETLLQDILKEEKGWVETTTEQNAIKYYCK
jgi:hypothetical protein